MLKNSVRNISRPAAISAAIAMSFLAGCSQQNSSPTQAWLDTTKSPSDRAELLLAAMTLKQKQQQLVGNTPEIVPELPKCFGARHVRGIAELGIPTLRITNGPVGIGQNDCVDASLVTPESPRIMAYTDPSSAKATALPSAMAVAASFDHNVAGLFGEVVAEEAKALALHVFEAPGMNLARNPSLGRNFEYKGEDPFLAGAMSVSEIKAIQERGIIAMAKHFAANEQETNRMNVSQTIDRQVLHELYLLPFEMSVKDGQVASLMCSYNDVNGAQACENSELLTDVLRNQWGFEGYVQSDFFAVKSTAPSMKAGLDHLMPIPSHWSPEKLDEALASGALTESDINLALKRRYTQMFKHGIFERPLVQYDMDIKAGGDKARAIGEAGTVLLQNNGTLPYGTDHKNVVVIGKASQVYAQQAVAGGVVVGKPMGAGGGSSDVVPHYTVSPVDGIKNTLSSLGVADANVTLLLLADDNSDIDQAIAAAEAADAVIVMAGSISEEGADRATFEDDRGLGQVVSMGDNLDWYTEHPNKITSVTIVEGTPSIFSSGKKELNPEHNSGTLAMLKSLLGASENIRQKTTLVMKNNAGMGLPKHEHIVGKNGPAIVEAWFPGQEDGNIVANVLWGIVNPSAKSPVSYPYEGMGFLDYIANDPTSFPGVEVDGKAAVTYNEGLNIGYRWYDANVSGQCAVDDDGANKCLAFPFGHGLSYTTFSIENQSVAATDNGFIVSAKVTNTGSREGAEVVQVYAGIPSENQPPKRLVGFAKVNLAAGESQDIQLVINENAANHPLSIYNSDKQQWLRPEGSVTFYVGTSSSLADLVQISQ